MIYAVFAGSPADKAGLKKGDRIFGVSNKSTDGLTTKQIVDRLMGPIGTSMIVGIDHQGNRRNVTLVRAGPSDQEAKAVLLEATVSKNKSAKK